MDTMKNSVIILKPERSGLHTSEESRRSQSIRGVPPVAKKNVHENPYTSEAVQ